MIYLIIFILTSIILLVSIFTRRSKNKIFYVFFTLITLISMFRYGSGTDYFGYFYHFYLNPDKFSEALKMNSGMEIGYRLWMTIIKSLGMNFDMLVLLTAFLTMVLFFTTINNNSKLRLLSFIIFFAIYYNVYVNSGMRQGIALAIVIYVFYKYFEKRQFGKFFIGIILSSFFHISSLIALTFIPIYLLSKKTFNNVSFNLILMGLSLVFYLLDFSSRVVQVVNNLGIYMPYESSGINLITIFLRGLFLIYIYLLYRNKNEVSDFEKGQIYIYFIGTLLFFSISNIPVLSRLLEYFTILEIIFIPNLINKIYSYRERVLFTMTIISISGSIFLKDLNSFTIQQNYYNTGATEYRYTTFFNKNDIYEYKSKDRLEVIID